MSGDEAGRRMLRAAFGSDRLGIERLSGGLHGRCYRVTGAGFDYAVRLPAPDEGRHRLGAAAERRVLSRAAAAGIAPSVAPVDPGGGLVATRFLPGARAWSQADAREPENIERAAHLLTRLHRCDLSAELEPYRCAAAADDYVREAAARQALSAEQRRWRDELVVLARRFEAENAPATPCHNDLVASNILDDGELRLVDFEYAVLSSPLLDLAGLAGLNAYDGGQRARLVAAYYPHGAAPFDAARLDAAVRLVRLLAYFWVLAHGGAGPADSELSAFAGAMAAMIR